MKKIDALTSLRFFAAVAIVLHHSKSAFTATSWINSPIPLDYGVSFFFVLSGFILAHSHFESSSQPSVKSFYVARFARIWPLHIATFFLCLALIPERARVSSDSFLTVFANLTLVQSWIPKAGYFFSYNSVSWSISTEAFFYLCFPFLIKNLSSTWHWKFAGVLTLSIATLTIASVLPIQPYDPNKPFEVSRMGLTYISPLVRIIEFFLGMLTALAFRRAQRFLGRINTSTWTAMEIGALILIAPVSACSDYLTIFFRTVSPYGESTAEFLTHAGGAPAFMVVVFVMAFGKGLITRILSLRPLVVLGEASFALYLVHQIFIGWYFLNIPRLTNIPNNAAFFAYWLISISTSLLLWKHLETPLRHKIRTFINRSPKNHLPT